MSFSSSKHFPLFLQNSVSSSGQMNWISNSKSERSILFLKLMFADALVSLVTSGIVNLIVCWRSESSKTFLYVIFWFQLSTKISSSSWDIWYSLWFKDKVTMAGPGFSFVWIENETPSDLYGSLTLRTVSLSTARTGTSRTVSLNSWALNWTSILAWTEFSLAWKKWG